MTNPQGMALRLLIAKEGPYFVAVELTTDHTSQGATLEQCLERWAKTFPLQLKDAPIGMSRSPQAYWDAFYAIEEES